MYSTKGVHVFVDLSTDDTDVLNDPVRLESNFKKYAQLSGVTIVQHHIHQFTPSGVSGTFLLSESHMSFHTWPSKGYASMDLYTCGLGDPECVLEHIKHDFSATNLNVVKMSRGLCDSDAVCDPDSPRPKYYSSLQFHKDYS